MLNIKNITIEGLEYKPHKITHVGANCRKCAFFYRNCADIQCDNDENLWVWKVVKDDQN